jgi:RNA polymerase-binding transcription factor DksA
MSTHQSTVQPPAALTSRELGAFRRILQGLLRERETLLAELDPRAALHIDVATWSSSQSTKRVIGQISAALERIADGTFGTCSRCGQLIATERLSVVPHAEACVSCQILAEASS